MPCVNPHSRIVRVSGIATVILLLALAGLGWHSHQRLVSLRGERDRLAAQAAASGLRLGLSTPASPAQTRSRLRPDRTQEAKRTAAAVIAYGKEVERLRPTYHDGDQSVRERVAAETDPLLGLDDDQLRILIDEVLAAGDLGGFQRAEIVMFALNRMVDDHPRETLELITGTPAIAKQVCIRDGYPLNVIQKAAYGWATQDFDAALDWLREHRQNGSALVGMMTAAAERDPATALEVIRELGVPTETYPRYFSSAANTPEQRVALLRVLCDWRAEVVDSLKSTYDFDSGIRELAYDGSYGRNAQSFESAVGCIEAARLSPAELDLITREPHVRAGEAGLWIGWLEQALPPEIARERIVKLLPAWQKEDPAAAAAFAKEHGLKD